MQRLHEESFTLLQHTRAVRNNESENDQKALDEGLGLEPGLGDAEPEAGEEQEAIRNTLFHNGPNRSQEHHRPETMAQVVPVVEGDVPLGGEGVC